MTLLLLEATPVAAQSAADGHPPPFVFASSAPAVEQKKGKDAPPEGWHFAWDDHPSLRFGKDTRIDFRLRLQANVRDSDAETGDEENIDLARRRVGVHGNIENLVDFQIEREIDDDDPWRDVFVNYRQFAVAEVRAGKFKLPFSLDENTSATDLDFVYRSMAATELAPGRDTGVMVHGRVLGKTTRYEIGWFTHDGRNARTRDPELVSGDATLAGRVTVRPFRGRTPALRDLQAGVAFTTSRVAEGFPGLHGHTVLDAPFFPADVWVKGARRRTGLEARWWHGGGSIKAEYMRVTTERLGQSVEDTDLPPLVAHGWYVSGTYALTGEKKTEELAAPRHPLVGKGWGWGAIEIAGRVEELSFADVDGDVDASTSPRAEVILGNADRAATVGVNWYPIRRVKVQLNLIHERVADPARGPAPGMPTFWSRVLTFQLDL